MTLKELKAFFNAVETGTKDVYRLYDKSDMSRRALGRFIGEVAYNSRNKNAIFEYCVYNDCEVLKKACLEWADSLPFHSDSYDNSYRLHYRMELAADEYLKKLGFKELYCRNTYDLTLSIISPQPLLRVEIYPITGVTDQDDELRIQFHSTGKQFIQYYCKSIDSVVATINSVMSAVYTTAMPKLLNLMECVDVSAMRTMDLEVSTADDIGLIVDKTPLKQILIPKLEEALRILKNE